jgi:hypothetical protein
VSFSEWFYQGGIFMWFIVFADILAIMVITVLLIFSSQSRYKTFLIMVVAAGLVPLLFGAAGHWIGYRMAMDALNYVDPAQKQELYEAAMAAARIPTIFGGISSAVLLLVGIVGLKLR